LPVEERAELATVEVESAPLVVAHSAELEVPSDAPIEAIEVADDGPRDVTPRDEFKIQTMRVPPAKLDALMTLASELTVTTTRVIRGMTAFEEIGALCEEWNKELNGQRPLWQTGDARGDAAKQLASFQARDQGRLIRLNALWDELKRTTYQDVTRLNFVADELEMGIRNVRLLPLSQIFNLFPRLVRDLSRELGKEIDFVLEGGETAADKRILEELKDPLMHMIRNAVDHGIESPAEREKAGKSRVASIRLRAFQTANNVLVELSDDGRGLDIPAIKSIALKRRLHTEEELSAMSREQLQLLIFAPGFSTSAMVTDVSGRGVGMDVVRINIERLKGHDSRSIRAGTWHHFHDSVAFHTRHDAGFVGERRRASLCDSR
jgi:two-component system chemotaxis sensor kinase CheA